MSEQATIVALCDGVAARINSSGLLTGGVTAARRFRPVFDLTELATLHVTVTPATRSESRDGLTTGVSGDLAVAVILQQKLDVQAAAPNDAETLAAGLCLLAERITDLFRPSVVLVGAHRAVWMSVDNEPAYEHAALYQQHVFVCEQTLRFRVTR